MVGKPILGTIRQHHMAKNNGVIMSTTIIRSILIAMMNIIITEEMPTMPEHIMNTTQMV